MKNIKHLSDLTDLSKDDINKICKKYESSFSALRITGGSNFWIWTSIVGVIWFLYFTNVPLESYQVFFLILLLISIYYTWERLGDKKWFMEWYEIWWSDWIKRAIKFERSLTEERFSVMEDMDIESQIENK